MCTPLPALQNLLLTPHPTRPPNNSPHARQRRIRQRWQLHVMSLLSSPNPQPPPIGHCRQPLLRALPTTRSLPHNKQARIRRDRDNHDRDRGLDRGLDLQPEIDPSEIECAAAHAAGDTDDGDDHREDAEGEGAAEDELAAEGDADAPEEGDGDGDY